MKICNTCKAELPLNTDYWHRHSISKDGYKNDCKACRNMETKQRRKANKLKNLNSDNLAIPESKICSKCGLLKLLNESNFEKRIDTVDGFISSCKKCNKVGDVIIHEGKEIVIRNRFHGYYYEKLEYNRERVKEYHFKNRETRNSKNRANYSQNKQVINKNRKIWLDANKDKVSFQRQNRRTLRNNAISTLTQEQYNKTMKYFNSECAYCGLSNKEHLLQYGQTLHQDHVIPLSRSGGYTEWNIIPACISCNGSKKEYDLVEWYSGYYLYDKERLDKILSFIRYDKSEQISMI